MLWLISFTLSLSSAHAALKKVASCETKKDSTKYVAVVKQWHLAPKTITKGFKEKYPQELNQTNIFLALNEQIKKKKLQIVVAEGCEGEINNDFKTAFNGWTLESLKKEAQRKNYERIVSHVPLKLEARHGDKVLTLCGDNDKLIQEGNLRVSNLRGWFGFWLRLADNGEDAEKRKLFAETAADLLKVSRETPVEKLVEQVKERLKSELEAFNKSLKDRNDSFVKVLADKEFTQAAIVIGGLHAEDLKQKLQAAGFNCDVFEPRGYEREDEDLVKDFEKALN